MDTENMDHKHSNDDKITVKSSSYRWIILFLYGFAMASNAGISICLFNIGDVVCKHYNVSDSLFLLSWSISTVICLVSYVLGMFLPSRYGLRTTVVIGSGITAIGAALYIPAAQTNGFICFFISQCCWGFSTGIMYQLATDISEVWFPAHQHALATNINLSMVNVGYGISYLQTMFLFNNAKSMSNAELQISLNILIYSQGALCLLSFVFNLFFYRDSPKYPPSISQNQRIGPGNIPLQETVASIMFLVKDFKFILFAIIFGFNSAFNNTYLVIANILITPSYNNGEKLVSIIGVLAATVGCVGSVLFSMILDKTKKFKKLLMLLLVVSSVLFVLFFEFLIHIYPIYVIYLASTLSWFFFTPTTGVLADIISEITYPINNSTSFAFCSVVGSLLTVALTQICGKLGDKNEIKIMVYLFCAILGIQILLIVLVPVVKKRSLCSNNNAITSVEEKHLQPQTQA